MKPITQNTTPLAFERTTRPESYALRTSGRAGQVKPVCAFPMFRGDSGSGKISFEGKVAEMPRPLMNSVFMKFQAWVVPRNCLPHFSGMDEFLHAYQGEDIKQLGTADRTPPPLFDTLTGADIATAASSDFMKGLGLHVATGKDLNTDYIDAFNLIYNFRLNAHSNKLAKKSYAQENLAAALALPPAFWPTNWAHGIVSDYERALVVGNLDLDVIAGRMPVSGVGSNNQTYGAQVVYETGQTSTPPANNWDDQVWVLNDPDNTGFPGVYAEMAGQVIGTSLADIDKSRQKQAMARAVATFRGVDYSGFEAEDMVIAELMQGFMVPEHNRKRPILLDSKTVPVGFIERHATDGANLADSVSTGEFGATLSLNIPMMEAGAVVIVTCEMVPERLFERQSDEYLHVTAVGDLPAADRDSLRVEPVDTVINRRIDAKHSTPDGAYGFEPMNRKWSREGTRLGGAFFQDTPGTPVVDQRQGLWQPDYVDPVFASSHYLVPDPFPHNVFSDTLADAFEMTVRHNVAIRGLTQKGENIFEANDDYVDVAAEQG